MIDCHNTFCQAYFNFLTVETQNTLIYFPAEPNNINTLSPFQRLRQLLKKSNKGLISAPYSSPSLWKKLPIEIKRSGRTNGFKHNVQNYYVTKI